MKKALTNKNRNKIDFDQEISTLQSRFDEITEQLKKDGQLKTIIEHLIELKLKAMALSTSDPNEYESKRQLLIKLCEQIVFCYMMLKEPAEAIKFLTELEIMQDFVAEKNIKCLLYKARCYLQIKDLRKAFDSFSAVYGFDDIDPVLKVDIETILIKIQNEIKDQDDTFADTLNDLMIEIKTEMIMDETSTSQMTKKCEVSNKKSSPYLIKINILKSSSGILSEFMTKFAATVPHYELQSTTGVNDKKLFSIICRCLLHDEEGTASSKKKAKEIASKKMINYFQDIGKLKLVEGEEQ